MAEKTSPPSAYRPSKTAQTAVPRRAIAKPAAAKQTPKAAGTPEGERIAKVLSRVGVASQGTSALVYATGRARAAVEALLPAMRQEPWAGAILTGDAEEWQRRAAIRDDTQSSGDVAAVIFVMIVIFIMVAIAATFFWIVDLGLGFLFQRIISFGV